MTYNDMKQRASEIQAQLKQPHGTEQAIHLKMELEQLERKLATKPVLSFRSVTFKLIHVDELNALVNAYYGGGFDFSDVMDAEDAMYPFWVVKDNAPDNLSKIEEIRQGKIGPADLEALMYALYMDGALEEGVYLVDATFDSQYENF